MCDVEMMAAKAGTTCFFCGAELATAGRAREHVLPQWLLRHYDLAGTVVEPAWTNGRDGAVRDQRRHPLKAMVLGPVCAPCNNGWMSALEAEARPLLLKLAGGRASIDGLSPAQRVLLARWGLKTAAALNRSSNFTDLVTSAQAASSRGAELTDGVVVLGHVAPKPDTRDPFWWLQHQGIAQMLNFTEDDDLASLQAGAWRCFIAFEQLCLLVMYAKPSPRWRWFLDPAWWSSPVWPLEGTWLHRRTSSPPNDDLRSMSVWMSMSVGFCRTGDERGIEAATIEAPY